MKHAETGFAINRRSFLQVSASLAAAPWVGAFAQTGDPSRRIERALILIELRGGNDGLATVVPRKSPSYLRVRSTALVQPSDVLELDPQHGLHPNLGRLALAFRASKLAILEGIGVPGGVRSHFRATDIWHSADPVRAAAAPGWIAQLGDLAWPTRGSDAVVHFGADPLGCHFSATRAPLAVENPDHFATLGEGPNALHPDPASKKKAPTPPQATAGGQTSLDRIRQLSNQAAKQSLRIRAATAGYRTPIDFPKTALGQSVRDIAALLNLGDGAAPRVLSATLGGFDTHARQKNVHDRQMLMLDEALGALLADLERTDIGRQAVVLVYSEFGRRVNENGSQGTDHGKGAPAFVLGHSIQGGIYGEPPNLDDLDDGDLKVTTDFRSIYATLIEGLFDQDSRRLLGVEVPKLEFLG